MSVVAMSAGITIRVLGPVCVDRLGDLVDCGPPQQQATLAVLAINLGASTPVARIIDAIWGDDAPSSAPGTVRTCVYRLRKIFAAVAPDAVHIDSTSQGYVLRAVHPDVVDMHRFARLVNEARANTDTAPPDQADDLRQAIDLWRGSAFLGLDGEYFENERHRLAGERVSASVRWCEAVLDAGQPDRVVSTLREAIAFDPFKERPYELLILALVLLSRRAEALSTYEAIRRRLADELGIDPGPGLRELHQRVLQDDPTLLTATHPAQRVPPPSLVPAQLPTELSSFCGRDAEVAEVLATLAPITFVHGTAGVGKTTLAVHIAHRIAPRFPDGQLFVNLRGFDRADAPVQPSQAIKSILIGFGIPAAQLPDDEAALAAGYRSVMADKRCLIVLDNARDSMQILPLLPGHPRCAVIVTSRAMLTRLVTVVDPHVVALDLLSSHAAEDLLRARLGDARIDAEPLATRQIVARCARLPLALAITAARASLLPHLTLAGLVDELSDADQALDAFHHMNPDLDVRSVISWSYLALSPETARLFRLLAIHPGVMFDTTVAANLLGTTRSAALPMLHELARANLIHQHRPRFFTWHDLIRAAATEEAKKYPQDRVAAFGRIVGYYLQSMSRAAAVISTNHTLAPGVSTDDAALTTESFADYDAAISWISDRYQTILSLIDECVRLRHHSAAWQLAWCLRHFQDRQGHWADLLAVQRIVLTSAQAAGDLDGVAHAHRGIARAMTLHKDYAAAQRHILAAATIYQDIGDGVELAYCKRQHAMIAELLGDTEGAFTSAREALDIFRELDWKPGIAASLSSVGHYATLTGSPGQGIAFCEEAIAMLDEADEPYGLAMTWGTLGYVYYSIGEYQRSAHACEEALRIHPVDASYTRAGFMQLLLDVHAKLENYARVQEISQIYRELSNSLTSDEHATIQNIFAPHLDRRSDSSP